MCSSNLKSVYGRIAPKQIAPRRVFHAVLTIVTIFALAGCTAFDELAQPLPVSLPARFSSTPLSVGSQSHTVGRGRVVRTLEFAGIVRSSSEYDLVFPVEGGVARVYVKSGDKVMPGDVIAELESSEARMEVANAQLEAELAELRLQEEQRVIATTIDAAQLKLETAQLELERLQLDTRTTGAEVGIAQHAVRVAQVELDQAKLRTDAIAAKQVEAAHLAIDQAGERVDRLTLRATISGTVRLDPILREGNAVDAYEQVGRVVDGERVVIESELNPTDLELIATAVQGELKITTLSGFTGKGHVLTIPQPYGNGSTPYLQIAPENDNNDFNLLEGTNVVVRMEVMSSQDVLILPNDAIQVVAGRNYVVVRDVDVLRDQEIAIGLRGDTHTQVVDGLSEGMEIIAP